MIIAQITDIHISPDFQPARGVDVVQNFEKILSSLRLHKPDLIVLSGDICLDKPHKDTMIWVKKRLDELSIPYYVIAGNHDDSLMMAEVFELEAYVTGEVFYDVDLDGSTLILLDSADGTVSGDQLTWLAMMNAVINENFLIFIHHPPVDAVPYMDLNHGLQNKGQIQEYFTSCHNLKGVFCGHYHIDKVVDMNGIPVHLTPSAYFQIDDSSPEFKVSGYEIGWRKINWDGKVLETEVIYC